MPHAKHTARKPIPRVRSEQGAMLIRGAHWYLQTVSFKLGVSLQEEHILNPMKRISTNSSAYPQKANTKTHSKDKASLLKPVPEPSNSLCLLEIHL